MNGTRVVLRLKKNDGKAKKVLYFMGLPSPYHLYLCLKDDFEFCPEGIDHDTDIVLQEYRNVYVEMTPINIVPTHMRKVDHAKSVIGRAPDLVEIQDEGLKVNRYIWHNVKAYHCDQLISDIGGFKKGNKYVLFEEEKADGSILVS